MSVFPNDFRAMVLDQPDMERVTYSPGSGSAVTDVPAVPMDVTAADSDKLPGMDSRHTGRARYVKFVLSGLDIPGITPAYQDGIEDEDGTSWRVVQIERQKAESGWYLYCETRHGVRTR